MMYRKFLLVVILGCMLCGIAAAEELQFKQTIQIEGTVRQTADGGLTLPLKDFPLMIALVKSPNTLNQPYDSDPAAMKYIATIRTDSNGYFSYSYTAEPTQDLYTADGYAKELGYLVVIPQASELSGEEKLEKFELIKATADPDILEKNSNAPGVVVFSLWDIWIKPPASSLTKAQLEWKATLSSISVKNSLGGDTVLAQQESVSHPSMVNNVTRCMIITEPGYYVLQRDISFPDGDASYYGCIRIQSPDVIFNGNNRKLIGRNQFRGIAVFNNNVTISDVSVSNYTWGIVFKDCSNGQVRNATITRNGLYHADGKKIQGPGYYEDREWTKDPNDQGYGIHLDNTTEITITDSQILENNVGIMIEDGHDNLIGGLPPCGGEDYSRKGNSVTNGWGLYGTIKAPPFGYYQNVFDDNHIGIVLVNTTNNRIISNGIFESRDEDWLNNVTKPQQAEHWFMGPAGISVMKSDHNEFKLNTIWGNAGDGIFLYASKENEIAANVISDNFYNDINLWDVSILNTIHTNVLGRLGYTFGSHPLWKYIEGGRYENGTVIQILHNGSIIHIPYIWWYKNNIFNNYIYVYNPEDQIEFSGYGFRTIDTQVLEPKPGVTFYATDHIDGKNIVGGPTIGGNYWDTDQEPFSLSKSEPGSADTNNDGFLDTAFCAYDGLFCKYPDLDAEGVDYYPLVASASKKHWSSVNELVFSNSLTGDLCVLGKPDEHLGNTLTGPGLARNNNPDTQNPSGWFTLPKMPVIIPPDVQEEVYEKKGGELKTPPRPFSIVDSIISFPQTVISVLQGSAPESSGSDTQEGTTATVIKIHQEEPAPPAPDSVKVAVLDEGKEKGTATVIVNDVVRPEVVISDSSSGTSTNENGGTLQEARVVLPETTAMNRAEIAQGMLICPPDQRACNGVCRDVLSDRNNCGACGFLCESAYVCTQGACTPFCNSGLTSCNGACVSLQTDTSNCGSCGHTCLTGATCTNGVCVLQMVTTQPTRLGSVGMRVY